MRDETGEVALAEQDVVGVVNLVVGKGPAEPDRLFAVMLISDINFLSWFPATPPSVVRRKYPHIVKADDRSGTGSAAPPAGSLQRPGDRRGDRLQR
jgi:hypothetical protein